MMKCSFRGRKFLSVVINGTIEYFIRFVELSEKYAAVGDEVRPKRTGPFNLSEVKSSFLARINIYREIQSVHK